MKKFITIIILVVAAAISCSSPEEAAKALFDNGLLQLKAGQSEQAKETFESILTKYPQSPLAYHGLSVYYDTEDFFYEAIDANNRVLTEHPDFLPALYLNSQLTLQLARPELTLFSISLYLEKGGDKGKGVALESKALLNLGKVDKAFKTLEKAKSELAENPLFLLARAEYCLHTGEYNDGIEFCTNGVSVAQDDPSILKMAGDFYKMIGLKDSAAFYYDRAMTVLPEDYYLKTEIAESLIEMKYYHRAEKLLAEFSMKADKTHRWYLLRAMLLKSKGKHRNASMEYGMIIPHYSSTPTVMINFANLKWRAGDRRGGDTYSETAIDFARTADYPTLAVLGMIMDRIDMFLDMNKPNRAGELVEPLADSLPNDFQLRHHMAFLYWYLQAEELQAEAYRKMDASAQGVPGYMAKAGALYVRTDSLNKAQTLFTDVLKIDKTNQTAILGAIDIHRKRNALSQALQFLDGFDEYLFYSQIPGDAKLSIYEALGEYGSAVQFVEQMIKVSKEDLKHYRNLIRLESEHGNKKRLPDIYQMCLDNNPDNPDVFIMAAKYYLESGDMKKSEGLAIKALELDSLHVDGQTLCADLLAEQGKTDEAIALYEKIMAADQYAGDAIGSLAVLHLLKGENPQVVLQMARKASLVDGGNPKHHCTQGRALYADEKYQMARVPFENALKFAQDDPEINFYSGRNLYKFGDKVEAKKQLRKAIKNGLTGNLKTEAEEILKKL